MRAVLVLALKFGAATCPLFRLYSQEMFNVGPAGGLGMGMGLATSMLLAAAAAAAAAQHARTAV